jgi:glycosyltransferase involved in cell wall biosynthesis
MENERYGGGERAFSQLINGLDKRRFEVFAACLSGTPGSEPLTRAIAGSAKIIPLDLRRLVNPSAVPAIKKIIRENGIGIVHSQGPRADFYARLAAHGSGGVRLASTVASPVEEYDVGFLKKVAYTVMDRFMASSVDKYVAVAEHIRRKLVEGRGIPAGRVVRIYNGVAPEHYRCSAQDAAAARAALNIPTGRFLVAAFCRLSAEKGLFTLLEAVALNSGSGIQYLIAGSGPLEAELKARASALGVEKDVTFAGFVENPVPLLCAADMVVLPSLREGFPVALLEAMAAGKPVAASRIEGVDESVEDGRSGLLVPAGDAMALAAAIKRLSSDTAAAQAMGRHGSESVLANFSEARMIEAHQDLYEELNA